MLSSCSPVSYPPSCCRQLAQLEEEEGLLLTPFERNLEVWRQLWRVLERSDIVVQVGPAQQTFSELHIVGRLVCWVFN